MQALEQVGLGQILSDLRLRLSGWMAQSYAFNPHRPADRVNVFRVFDDRANDYRFNQLCLVLKRPLGEGAGMVAGDVVFTF